MMKNKTCRPCFSCGSEAGWWIGENCDNCIKSSHEKKDDSDDYTKSRCRIFDDILRQWMGYGNEEISVRSYEVTKKMHCPYKQTKWKKRKQKDNDKSLTLHFETERHG